MCGVQIGAPELKAMAAKIDPVGIDSAACGVQVGTPELSALLAKIEPVKDALACGLQIGSPVARGGEAIK